MFAYTLSSIRETPLKAKSVSLTRPLLLIKEAAVDELYEAIQKTFPKVPATHLSY